MGHILLSVSDDLAQRHKPTDAGGPSSTATPTPHHFLPTSGMSDQTGSSRLQVLFEAASKDRHSIGQTFTRRAASELSRGRILYRRSS
jgi:hypothetical protein